MSLNKISLNCFVENQENLSQHHCQEKREEMYRENLSQHHSQENENIKKVFFNITVKKEERKRKKEKYIKKIFLNVS